MSALRIRNYQVKDYNPGREIKLTSNQIVEMIEKYAAWFAKKYSKLGEFYYVTLYREILKAVKHKVKDGHYYSRNNYYLISWEIMVEVCKKIHGELRNDFPHLVVGANGQGLLQKLTETSKVYKTFRRPFE